MKINKKDLRNFLLTLFISVIFMSCLYFGASALRGNKNVEDLFQSLHIHASTGPEEIQESVSDVTDDIRKAIDEYISSCHHMLNEINIDINARELYVMSTYYDTFLITSEPSVDELIHIDADGKVFNITSPKYLDSKVCIYIPQELFENQKISVNVNATGFVSIKNIVNASNDAVFVKATDGIVAANNIRCEQLELSSVNSDIIASYCYGNIARYTSENSSVTFDGEYNEVSVVAADDITANINSNTNRMDISSSDGNVILYLNDTDGFNLTLNHCKGDFYSEYPVELSALSKYGSVIYNYGTNTSQIYISDVVGEIKIYKYME
ncbi:MAG: hypothetical protein E7218_08640 [Anaerofustis stercorihominis]|nr:hypothetical protein [Anaerofustis stercorihominis]